MNPKKGLATYAGLVAAAGQYVLSIALFMDTFNEADPLAGLGPLATATATLYGVIKGRMDQATALAAKPALGGVTSSSGASTVVSWGTASQAARTKPGEFDREPPAPNPDEIRDIHDGEIT